MTFAHIRPLTAGLLVWIISCAASGSLAAQRGSVSGQQEPAERPVPAPLAPSVSPEPQAHPDPVNLTPEQAEVPGEPLEEAPAGPSAAELAALEPLRADLVRAAGLLRRGGSLDARLLWARVARAIPGSLESLRAALSLTEDALERMDPKAAQRWLKRARLPDLPEQVMNRVETLSKLRQRRRRLALRVASWPLDPPGESRDVTDPVAGPSIGVLLPLSGPYARFGNMAKRGLDLAFAGSGISLRIADTQGTAELARTEALRLIAQEGVTLIVGPIGREETRASAEISQAHEVPMITLSSYPAALSEISSAIRIRFSPGDHARAVARLAVAEMGLQRLAVVYPQSKYGLEALDAFWAEARRLGATLSVVHALGSDVQSSKARRRQELVGVAETSASALSAANQLAQVHEPGAEGSQPYDGLFLPLTKAVRVRELVRVLHGRGVPIRTHPSVLDVEGRPTIQLLGLYGFNRASIVDMGDRLTENSIFAVGFAHDPDQPDNHRFVNAYLQRYGNKPVQHGEYAAAGYDAGHLALEILKGISSSPRAPRAAALRAIRELRHVRGALGDRTLRPDGGLSGRPTLLTVEKDEIRARLPEAEEAAIRARPQRRRKR
jgi:ABC-type branched-subunit amino acid transport system substrate-binding protein